MTRTLAAYLLRVLVRDMSLLRMLESWTEALIRLCIGGGLCWIGFVEAGGYGLFLKVVGGIFVAAGIGEIWAVEAAPLHHMIRRKP
jgi:hypothetical protein